jgi:hypothetical protein
MSPWVGIGIYCIVAVVLILVLLIGVLADRLRKAKRYNAIFCGCLEDSTHELREMLAALKQADSRHWHLLTVREHWKGLALACETLCECCADLDEAGARNASKEVVYRRTMLRMLGEYTD